MTDGLTIGIQRRSQLFKIIAPCMVRRPSGKRTLDENTCFEEIPNPFSVYDKMADQVSNLIDSKLVTRFAHDGTMTKASFDKATVRQGGYSLTYGCPADP